MGVGLGCNVDDTEAVVSAVVTDAVELPTADDTDPASAAAVEWPLADPVAVVVKARAAVLVHELVVV